MPASKVSRDRAHRAPEEEALRDLVQPLGDVRGTAGSRRRPPSRARRRRAAAAIALEVGHQVERRAVVEEAAPLGVEPDEVELAPEVAAGLGEDPPEHRGEGEDRRPHVEAEALRLQRRGLAAQPGVALEERHPVAARRQGGGRGEAAEPRADDADAIRGLRHQDLLPSEPAWRHRAPAASGRGRGRRRRAGGPRGRPRASGSDRRGRGPRRHGSGASRWKSRRARRTAITLVRGQLQQPLGAAGDAEAALPAGRRTAGGGPPWARSGR